MYARILPDMVDGRMRSMESVLSEYGVSRGMPSLVGRTFISVVSGLAHARSKVGERKFRCAAQALL